MIPHIEVTKRQDAGTTATPEVVRKSDPEPPAAPESSSYTAPPPLNPEVRGLAAGWFLANRAAYTAELDYSNVYSGDASLRLASRTDEPRGFGDTGQAIRADAYRGKRVRLSGHLQTLNANGWAGLWFRVDGADGKMLAFDNMGAPERSLRGTRDWVESSLVLDVPENAAALLYGVVLSGSGTVWMDAMRIQVVDERTPVTNRRSLAEIFNPLPARPLPSSPVNLDFEP